MHLLVTGGAGYIGSHVVKQLLETTNYDITIIDNLSTGQQSTVEKLAKLDPLSHQRKFAFYHKDLADFYSVEQIFKTNNFDAVIHFAASIVVPESISDPLKYYMNNTVNTAHLIQVCMKYNVNKFIFSSTAAVYGQPQTSTVTETTPLAPINPYGMSKMMSERILQDTAQARPDFRYVILRYFNVAGANRDQIIGQDFPNATHLIKVSAETALGKRNRLNVYGSDYATPDGTCIRDYIHVDDLASAHLKGLEYLKRGQPSNIFNCGYGHGFSVLEVIKTMKKVSGNDFEVALTARREGDPASLIADTTKIKALLGWAPIYDDLEIICSTALKWESLTSIK